MKKINITNQAKINAEIKKAEGKANTRTLDYEDIKKAIRKAEKQLLAVQIPKKNWKGCAVTITPPSVANSYKYTAKGTGARIVRFSSDWFLTGIGRETCRTQAYGGGRKVELELSEIALKGSPTILTLS